MSLDSSLLEILACPEDHGPLLYFAAENTLYNPRLRTRYRVKDDVPQLVIAEAERVAPKEHERLIALGARATASQ